MTNPFVMAFVVLSAASSLSVPSIASLPKPGYLANPSRCQHRSISIADIVISTVASVSTKDITIPWKASSPNAMARYHAASVAVQIPIIGGDMLTIP